MTSREIMKNGKTSLTGFVLMSVCIITFFQTCNSGFIVGGFICGAVGTIYLYKFLR